MGSSIPRDLQELGKGIHGWTELDESYKLLDSDPETSGGSWGTGGCLALAAAIIAWSGYRLSLARVVGPSGTEHYAATDGTRFFDLDGVSTRRQLEKRWKDVEGIDGAKVFSDGVVDTRDGQIPMAPKLVRKVALRLKRALGPADEYPNLRQLQALDRRRSR